MNRHRGMGRYKNGVKAGDRIVDKIEERDNDQLAEKNQKMDREQYTVSNMIGNVHKTKKVAEIKNMTTTG